MNQQQARSLLLALAIIFLAGSAFWLHRRPGSSPAPASPGWSPAGPQAKLQTVKLWLGTRELVAEVARSLPEINTGLMFRTHLGPDAAMLFLLPMTQQAAFYMRNTSIRLSCAYLDEEGVILELHDMKPLDESTILSAAPNIRFVIEVNRGWFETNHIGPGTLVRTDRGTLTDLLNGK